MKIDVPSDIKRITEFLLPQWFGHSMRDVIGHEGIPLDCTLIKVL